MHNLERAIEKERTATVKLTVKRGDGSPLGNRPVIVAQKNHQFLFGGNGSLLIPYANNELKGEKKERVEQINQRYLEIFNYVTLPFYWGRFEPQRGFPDTERLQHAARFYVKRGIPVKGHPLSWHSVTAEWLLALEDEEIMAAQLERVSREVADFKGLIDSWDVVNEAVIMPIFSKYDNGLTRICRKYGRLPIIRRLFAAARAANPQAVLLLNDFDISPAYDILIEGCLEAGIEIDAIGIQSHMHQGYWGVEKTKRVLANFTRFKLPIHFTETNLISGELMPHEITDLNDYRAQEWPTSADGEARQAQEVVLHYKTLLAHPDVRSITWWDFVDGLWLNAPSGLLRRDTSLKPAYLELLNLIKGEWWFPATELSLDQAGTAYFRGFLGEYELQLGQEKIPFSLAEKGDLSVELTI